MLEGRRVIEMHPLRSSVSAPSQLREDCAVACCNVNVLGCRIVSADMVDADVPLLRQMQLADREFVEEDTPSRRDGMPKEKEDDLRAKYCSLIASAGQGLQMCVPSAVSQRL